MASLAPIKKWTPRHEMVVSLHISGWSNLKIAEHFRITPVRVSQILCDPQAKALVRQANKTLRDKMKDDISDRLLTLAEGSVKNLEETIEASFLVGSDSKEHQDNVSLKILRGTGFLIGDKQEDASKTKNPLTETLAERLITALENSNEAERLNRSADVKAPLNLGDGKIQEADFEIVSEDAVKLSNLKVEK